jgi:membrane protease YdiL (CAAX protease family)
MLAPLLTFTLLGVLVVILPWLAWVSRQQLALLREVPRGAFYAQALLIQVLLGGLALAVAHVDNFELSFLRPSPGPSDELKIAIVLTFGGLLLLAVGLRYSSDQQRTLLKMLAPVTFEERVWWVVLTLAVAFVEEITYRAVLPQILGGLIPNLLVVMILSSLIFGAAHLLQGVESAVMAALIGFGLHILVASSGRLNSAIVVHFVYDAVAGFYIGKRLAEEDSEAA